MADRGFSCAPSSVLEGKDCKRIAVVALGVAPETYSAAVTTITRLYEEYGVDCILLVFTGRAAELAETLRKSGIVDDLKIASCMHLTSRPGDLERDLRKLIENLCSKYGAKNIVLSPTPGSRRLAAAIGMAGVGIGGDEEACNVDVAHIDFFWDAWSGLPYPLVPRWLEPLQLLNPVVGPLREPKRLQASSSFVDDVAARLPPLRKAIAYLAYSLNKLVTYNVSFEDINRGCGVELLIRLGGRESAIVNDVCIAESWTSAVKDLTNILMTLFRDEKGGSVVDEVILVAGLRVLTYTDDMQRTRHILELRELRKPVIVDTSLLYRGIHVEAYAGLTVLIPYCAYAEVMKNYAEALKPHPSLRNIASFLAGLALQELQHAGGKIVPSPPPPCDTSIPSMDPLMLSDTIIATADKGAFELWRSHPVSKIAQPVLVEGRSVDAIFTSEKLIARASYALFQAVTILATTCVAPGLQVEISVGSTKRKLGYKDIIDLFKDKGVQLHPSCSQNISASP